MMNSGRFTGLVQSATNIISGRGLFGSQLRYASKKATGGNRNPKQAKGNHHGIKKNHGHQVYPGDILVFKQSKLWFHPGLNVAIARRFNNLVALKEGIVKITCEKQDLNFKNDYVKKYYEGREGQVFFKKYFNVVPKPQHTIFKCIDQI